MTCIGFWTQLWYVYNVRKWENYNKVLLKAICSQVVLTKDIYKAEV